MLIFCHLVFSFYHAASMQGALSHKQNVSLSVCPSVEHVDCDKTKASDLFYDLGAI